MRQPSILPFVPWDICRHVCSGYACYRTDSRYRSYDGCPILACSLSSSIVLMQVFITQTDSPTHLPPLPPQAADPCWRGSGYHTYRQARRDEGCLRRLRRAGGLAPVKSLTLSPFLKKMKVGMARIPRSWARSGRSSTSNLAKKILSLNSSDSDHL